MVKLAVIHFCFERKMTILAETYFKKSFKGYDPAQVDEFIVSLSDTYSKNEAEMTDKLRAVEAENARLREEIAELNRISDRTDHEHDEEIAAKQKEFDELFAGIGEKMVVADQRASDIIRNAEKEANLILSLARQNSENEAKAIRLRAEDEANKIIDDTRKKCDQLSAAAEEFRRKQDEMTRSMAETENRFASAISKLREDISN